jgi:hypothetical protein
MKTRVELIEEFLKTIKVENIDIPYYIDASEVNSFDEMYDAIDENRGFEVEIIYYASAMDYLRENDPSLNESMEIAEEYGYTPKNINSELLASLLASRYCRDEFESWRDTIETFFDELEDNEALFIGYMEEKGYNVDAVDEFISDSFDEDLSMEYNEEELIKYITERIEE